MWGYNTVNCWHCNTELIWGGDHDLEEENEDYSMVTNLSCPKCHSFVEVYYPSEKTLEDYKKHETDFSNDLKDRTVDIDLWSDIVPLLTGPPKVSIEVVGVEDGDYTFWGIDDASPVIETRFMSLSDKGTSFLDAMSFTIGSKIPDKQGYYARPEIDKFVKPVVFLDAQWTDELLDFLNNVPYERN